MGHITVTEFGYGTDLQETFQRVQWKRDNPDYSGEDFNAVYRAEEAHVTNQPLLSDDHEGINRALDAVLRTHRDIDYIARAIPVVKVVPARYERRPDQVTTHNVDVHLKSRQGIDNNNGTITRAAILPTIIAALGVKEDEVHQVHFERKPRVSYRYTAETGEGKAETRYFVIPQGSEKMPEWSTGHATQALARASVNGLKENVFQDEGKAYDIVGMIRRDNGGALVTSSRVMTEFEGTLKVTVRRKVADRQVTQERGWLFITDVHI